MPPLREIREDIPVLANHFLEKHSKAMRVDVKSFTPGAMQNLMRYSWPGNNRQLENEVKRLIASVRGKTITEEHLDPFHPASRDGRNSQFSRSGATRSKSNACSGFRSANPRRSRGSARTPHDRRRAPAMPRQQTKSGPGVRPEPPRFDQEIERLGF